MGLFKKEESTIARIRRMEKENAEIQRLNELHEKASKDRKPKKRKPVTYNENASKLSLALENLSKSHEHLTERIGQIIERFERNMDRKR